MSNRPASPPPAPHWKFLLGAALCIAVGATAFLLGESPPGLGAMMFLFVCFAGAIALTLAPHVLEYDARVRIAEAHARDSIEAQVRRLTQATEQLGHAVSRSQSTEEQAGQALGTIEELTEKLTAQAEELAQTLARSNEREIATLKAEIERLGHERDDRLSALDQRLDTVTGQLSEHQLNTRKSATSANKSLDELKERLIALAARLDDDTPHPRAVSMPPTASVAAPPPMAPVVSERTSSAEASSAAPADVPAVESQSAEAHHEGASASTAPESAATAAATATLTRPPAPAAAAAKPRARRASEAPAQSPAPSRISAKPQPLDLPLLDLHETRPIVPRDASGGGSTLVATAYIGIGNKLYVRGDGPGLSWNEGVPMQFLAIGKWGWTSPGTAEPITCRIYRNDETPMLDENIVITPGSKAEVTPRF